MWKHQIPQTDGLYWLHNRRLGLSTIAQVQHWEDGPHVRLFMIGELDSQEHPILNDHWEWWIQPLNPPEPALD